MASTKTAPLYHFDQVLPKHFLQQRDEHGQFRRWPCQLYENILENLISTRVFARMCLRPACRIRLSMEWKLITQPIQPPCGAMTTSLIHFGEGVPISLFVGGQSGRGAAGKMLICSN